MCTLRLPGTPGTGQGPDARDSCTVAGYLLKFTWINAARGIFPEFKFYATPVHPVIMSDGVGSRFIPALHS